MAKPRWCFRVSDVVAIVCLTWSLLLCVHLSNLYSSLHSTHKPDRGGAYLAPTDEEFEAVLRVFSSTPAPPLPPPLPHPLGPPLNLSGDGRQDLLLFTPILQSGSSTMRNLLGFLKHENNFKLFTDPPQKKVIIHVEMEEVQGRIAKNMSSVTEPTVLINSVAFIDFKKFGVAAPIRVSIVREPVELAISLYYRVRAPYQLVERFRQFPDISFPSRKFLKKSLESCLMNPRDPECRYQAGSDRFGHTIEFFCGHHKECLKYGSGEALVRAKRNVEQHYTVVGLIEEWPMTLAVLERYLPRYFANATEKYYDKINGRQGYVNKNFYKPSVESWAREKLAKNMTIESQFYDFLKNRLQRQYDALYEGS